MSDLVSLLNQAEALVNSRLRTLGIAVKQDDEAELQADLARIFEKHNLIMADYIQQGKEIPKSVYDAMSAEMQAVLEPYIGQVYIEGALSSQPGLADLASVSIDWQKPNTNAMNWARGYTFDLVRGLTDTTIEQVKFNIASLEKDVSEFFEKPTTLQELRGKIEQYIPDWTDRLGNVWSSAVRAEMIAITETTRASVQGQLDSVKFLEEDYGIKMVSVWQTSNDEKVCPICSPNNGKRQGDTWTDPPPAHPNCRCGISSVLAK